MSIAEIAALPVRTIGGGVCDLYLWTTANHLRDAFDVVDAWGFRYSCPLVWCKAPRGFNVGGKFQSNIEVCLYGERRSTTDALRRLSNTMDEAARARGFTPEDIDREFGFKGRMAGPHWLQSGSSQLAPPADTHWPKLKAILDLDGAVDELRDAALAERPAGGQVAPSRWYEWPRGRHSAKPEAFFDLVEQASPGPYLELFARRQRLGWDTWGDEALEHVQVG